MDGNSDSNLFAQVKIDQALELCNVAQEMWEEGKLDEALTNLDTAYASILEIDTEIHSEFRQQIEDVRYLISKRILEIYASRQTVANGQFNEIPITLNTFVQNEINSLTGPERQFFIQSLERSYRFRPYIVEELRKAGLPEEISWLPLIESGFKIRALSPARALGLWQFIPSTGYKFGLNRNYYIDERLDPEKSTQAAINYLKELHGMFGDWTTALAAYNCGEARVLGIIRQQKINYLDNFWDLYQKLPRETSRYVPRFLATLHIVENLEKYQIRIDQPWSPIEYKACQIKKPVRLSDIATEIDVDISIMKDLNPELRYATLPDELYSLKVPEDKADLFMSRIEALKTAPIESPQISYVYHRVKKKETLSGIAQEYNISLPAITSLNKIGKGQQIITGQMLKVPAKPDGTTVTKTSTAVATEKRIKYTVQRGDNLWNLAGKFNTTTKTIMAANDLKGGALTVGQKLTIPCGKQAAIAKRVPATHKVRNGDSPFLIAKKYNISLDRLLALNHLNKKSKIFPGQNLIVE